MHGMLTIYRREIASMFLSPMAWVLLAIALLLNGIFFTEYLDQTGGDVSASLGLALGGSWLFWGYLVMLPPLLTMRSISEESRAGTLEYLLTAPVTDAAVILGKFFASTTFLALLWLSVPIYALKIHTLGVAPDWSGLIGIYLGSVLVSGLFVSIGLLSSSLTNIPIMAAFLAFIACLSWLLLGMLGSGLASLATMALAPWPELLETVHFFIAEGITRANVVGHFQTSFRLGVFDSAEVIFFVTWTGFFLFLTVRSLEARRWRG
ncbi:MAG: ABC-2 type transport system permease protein [Planctomycetota bacterium]|jgi:ABC-2 type transport system permease protein